MDVNTRFVSEEIVAKMKKSGYEDIESSGVHVLVSPDIRLADNAELKMHSILGLKFFETRGVIPMKMSCSLSY